MIDETNNEKRMKMIIEQPTKEQVEYSRKISNAIAFWKDFGFFSKEVLVGICKEDREYLLEEYTTDSIQA